MKIFKEYNTHGKPCPICKTKKKKATVLVISKVPKKGEFTAEAFQVHLDCIPDLKYNFLTSRFEADLKDALELR